MNTVKNNFLIYSIKIFVRKLLQFIFTFFVSSYVVAMFRAADPIFISFLDFSRDELLYCDRASSVFKSYAEDQLIAPSNLVRDNLRSNFFTMSRAILENWSLSKYLDMDADSFRSLCLEGLVNCYKILTFLPYAQWLHFWFVTLHPLMPWSFFWDSHDMSSVNEVSYKLYIRMGFRSLFRAASSAQNLTDVDKWLASNLLGYITTVIYNDCNL